MVALFAGTTSHRWTRSQQKRMLRAREKVPSEACLSCPCWLHVATTQNEGAFAASLQQLSSTFQRSELHSAPVLLDASRVCCVLQVLRRVAGSRAAGIRHPTEAGEVVFAIRLFLLHGCPPLFLPLLCVSCHPSCQPFPTCLWRPRMQTPLTSGCVVCRW